MSTPPADRSAARMLLIEDDARLLLFHRVDSHHPDVAFRFTAAGVQPGGDLAASGEVVHPPALAELLALRVARDLPIAEAQPA